MSYALEFSLLVPSLRVGTQNYIQPDAERPFLHSHAERGNERNEGSIDSPLRSE